jgi:hypothetical protein
MSMPSLMWVPNNAPESVETGFLSRVHGCDTAPTPKRVAEVVSDSFSVLLVVFVFGTSVMNVRLVVLIGPFKVHCRPIDTVSVLTGRAGVISIMPLWNLVVDGTLGQYICLCCLLAFDADRFYLE